MNWNACCLSLTLFNIPPAPPSALDPLVFITEKEMQKDMYCPQAPWDLPWLAVETAHGRLLCGCLSNEIPEHRSLALIDVQLVAPTERPLTAGVCGQRGAWALSLATGNSFKLVMFSSPNSWNSSLSCLSVCARRFAYHWIRFVSTKVCVRYKGCTAE